MMNTDTFYRFWLLIICIVFVTALAISYSDNTVIKHQGKEYINTDMVVIQGRIYKEVK